MVGKLDRRKRRGGRKRVWAEIYDPLSGPSDEGTRDALLRARGGKQARKRVDLTSQRDTTNNAADINTVTSHYNKESRLLQRVCNLFNGKGVSYKVYGRAQQKGVDSERTFVPTRAFPHCEEVNYQPQISMDHGVL